MIITGAYVARELWDETGKDTLSRRFAMETLKFRFRSGFGSKTGEIMVAPSPITAFYRGTTLGNTTYSFRTGLNPYIYPVESPDALEPADEGAFTIFRYRDNRLSAGVAYRGDYRIVTLGFPLETLETEEQQERLVKECMDFFNTDK